MTLKRLVSKDRGSELLEFAMVLPLLLIMVAAIVDFAFLFQAYGVVSNAAVEGSRLASLPGYTDTDAENRVASYISSANLPGAVSTAVTTQLVTPGTGPAFTGVRVDVTYTHQFSFLGPMMGLFGYTFGSNVNFTVSSVMRPEVAVAP